MNFDRDALAIAAHAAAGVVDAADLTVKAAPDGFDDGGAVLRADELVGSNPVDQLRGGCVPEDGGEAGIDVAQAIVLTDVDAGDRLLDQGAKALLALSERRCCFLARELCGGGLFEQAQGRPPGLPLFLESHFLCGTQRCLRSIPGGVALLASPFGCLARRDVFDRGNQGTRFAAFLPHQRHRRGRPEDRPVLADVALLDDTAVDFADEHAPHLIAIGSDIIRMGIVLKCPGQHFALAVTEHFAEFRVHPQPVAIECNDGDTDRRLLENGPEAAIALLTPREFAGQVLRHPVAGLADAAEFSLQPDDPLRQVAAGGLAEVSFQHPQRADHMAIDAPRHADGEQSQRGDADPQQPGEPRPHLRLERCRRHPDADDTVHVALPIAGRLPVVRADRLRAVLRSTAASQAALVNADRTRMQVVALAVGTGEGDEVRCRLRMRTKMRDGRHFDVVGLLESVARVGGNIPD
jgi:hypothetical protein